MSKERCERLKDGRKCFALIEDHLGDERIVKVCYARGFLDADRHFFQTTDEVIRMFPDGKTIQYAMPIEDVDPTVVDEYLSR